MEPNKLCKGCPSDAANPRCRFSRASEGTAVELTKKPRRQQQCAFCSAATMASACASPVGRGNLSCSMKTFHAWKQQGRGEIFDAAMERVRQWQPEEANRIAKAAEAPQRKTAAQKAVRQEEEWTAAKDKRRATAAAATSARKRAYRAEVVEDRRVALKRFWPDAPRQKRARTEELDQAVSNDSGLPAATHSELSAGLRRWCERGAWGACPECGILQARPLHQQAITRKSTQPPTVAKSLCKRCCSQQQPYVPKPEDVPEPLRDLSAEILAALRVLEVDVGPEERATNAYGLETGYRKHGKMLRLSWADRAIKQKIAEDLGDRTARRKARAAYRFLKTSENSTCAYYLQEHKKFLAKHEEEGVTERQRLRPMHTIEEIGVECAIWPDLYWTTDMCETYARESDGRRLARLAKGMKKKTTDERADGDSSSEDSGSEQEPRRDSQLQAACDGSGAHARTSYFSEESKKVQNQTRRTPNIDYV